VGAHEGEDRESFLSRQRCSLGGIYKEHGPQESRGGAADPEKKTPNPDLNGLLSPLRGGASKNRKIKAVRTLFLAVYDVTAGSGLLVE